MSAARSSQTSRQNGSATPLFEALVCETHHAAAATAIVTSSLNCSVEKRSLLDRSTIDRFLPIEPAVLLSLTRRSLLDIEPLSETLSIIDSFFASLRVLRRGLDGYFFDASEIGAPRSLVLHGQRLVRVSRATCHEALLAIRALDLETPGRLPDLYCDHARALSRLLLAAERGEAPCIDANGRAFMPELPQRRRSSRRTLGQNCRLLYRKAIVSAFVKDVSEGGLGLLRTPFLHADDIVTVELASGRRFKGSVAWTRGEAAGIQFDVPLNASDPILAL